MRRIVLSVENGLRPKAKRKNIVLITAGELLGIKGILGANMVYFIQGEITKLIKIGWTKRNAVKGRLQDLQVGSPDRLSVLKIVDGSAGYEKKLHQQFTHLRVRGEWFHPAEELLNFISSQSEGVGHQTRREWLEEELALKMKYKEENKLIKMIRLQQKFGIPIAYRQNQPQ